MKKISNILFAVLCIVAAVCSCQKPILVTGVTLDSKAMTLVVGDSETLVATVSPVDAANTNVIWSSSNSTVAKVDDGTVTAIGPGTAQISVKTDDGCFTDVCTVTVVAKEILPTSIKLAYPSFDLLEGGSAKLAVSITPDDSTDKSIVWTTSDPEVAVVTDGVVTALKAGTAEIVATTCNGLEAKCTVVVTCKVSGVALDYPTITLEEGETQQLTAKVYPSRASNLEVSWKSSDNNIALVSAEGLVKAVKAGTATVTVTTADGDFTDECEVIVKSKVANVELNKSATSLYVGDTETLVATITPANASNPAVNWYSEDESIAKVSATGQITAIKAGKTTICATTVDGGKHATCEVTVYNHVSKVSLDKTEILLYVGGEGASLAATVLPEDAPDRTVSWESSDSKIASVDSNGNVSPVAEGSAVITVKTNDLGLTATCKVTVKKIVLVSAITLSQTSGTIDVGKTLTLTATVSPSDVTDASLTWSSSDTSVATVDQNGKITGKKAGTATITATAKDGSGKSASCAVTVGVPVTEVKITQDIKTLGKGATYTLKTTITPSNATDKTLEWTSSDPTVATVDKNGTVTGKKDGEVTITATNLLSGKSGTIKIKVSTLVESITFDPQTITLKVGETRQVAPKILPADAANKELTWKSVNQNVVKVSADGSLTAVGVGQTQVNATATDNSGKKGTLTVIVEENIVPIESITLSETSLKLAIGDLHQLTATITPDVSKTKGVTWKSSATGVVTVDQKGVIEAVGSGTATITVSANDDSGKSASCTVTVPAPVKVKTINISQTSSTLEVGGTLQLSAEVLPADADNKEVTWATSSAKVATVSADGLVKAIGAGTATITVTAKDGSGVKATCTVTVVREIVHVKSISFTPPTELYVGQVINLKEYVTFNPTNATNKNVVWDLQRNGVLVHDGDIFTAYKAGTCNVTVEAEDGGSMRSCAITVKEVAVTGVELSETSVSIKVGGQKQLTANVLPSNATKKTVSWESSNTSVAKVSNIGVITAVAKGTCTIKAKTSNGKYAECVVTVYGDPSAGQSEGVDFEDL